MIQELFLQLDDDSTSPYNIRATAQIEPGPKDPEELYRIHKNVWASGQDLKFDAVFYPNHVEILSAEGSVEIGRFTDDTYSRSEDLERYLDSLEQQIREANEQQSMKTV